MEKYLHHSICDDFSHIGAFGPHYRQSVKLFKGNIVKSIACIILIFSTELVSEEALK